MGADKLDRDEERRRQDKLLRLFHEVVETPGGVLHGLAWNATYTDIERARGER